MPTDSYLLLNNLRFHYRDWGGTGRAAVLLHGLASNARIWDFVAPQLAGHFRVVALDQRSHGLTDPASEGFDFPSLVRDLHAFLEALDLPRPLLVGHSWGGNTVLQYAATRPSGPAGIVLVDGGFTELASVPGMTWEKAEKLLRPPDLDGMPREEFLTRLQGWMNGQYSAAAAEIVLASFRVDEADRIYRRLPVPEHMHIARAIYDQKTSELYPRLRCPALLCPAAPPEPRDDNAEGFLARKRAGVARARQASPWVQVRWFEDTVHDVPLHRPDELAGTIVGFGMMLAD
jgi:pimeloyl-ACP methyl ester carboxylesterase